MNNRIRYSLFETSQEETKDNFVMIVCIPVDAFAYKYANTID